MKKKYEVSYKKLKRKYDSNLFDFETTEGLEKSTTDIGQDRGIKALEFGLNVDINGYNLYLEGPSGVGKTMYTKDYLTNISKKKKVPQDWCYIYNFDNPNEPIAVSLPAGQGKQFRDLMDAFIKKCRKDIKDTFSNEDFEKEKALIKQTFENTRNDLMDALNLKAGQYGFTVKSANNGVYMLPVIDGNPIEEEAFDKLPPEVKKDFEEKSQIVQNFIMEAIGKIKQIQTESDEKINEWQTNVALLTINGSLVNIKNSFKRNKKINKFIEDVKQDILKNLSDFLVDEEENKMPTPPNMMMQAKKPWLNYRVNLFIDNSSRDGAPVIMDSNSSYPNIFGKLEYENFYGTYETDYMMLKPGLLHEANGGYIIFQAIDIVSNPLCYATLKKVLRTREITIENPMDQSTSFVTISLKPEPIPLDLKVILIGEDNIYQTLLSIDADFRKLFKIKVEFEEDAPLTKENANKIAQVVQNFCTQESLPVLDRNAMAKVIEYSTRLANNQDKISTKFSKITQIVGEAATWAIMDKSKIITAEYITKALQERELRVQKYNEKYMEMINDQTILIDVKGSTVGQINGLTVMSIGDYSFGLPARITASTYVGKNGITNIEKEVDMSGSSHTKGVLILTGYLGDLFAQDMPLSLTANLCFEQLYNGVDGDSASSTELYAILSSLSDIPINQGIAVTGSVNQKGFIQPIGGVNEKIEGFFNVCKMKGFTGSQGVMIPTLNLKNLNLNDEIVEAVKNGEFHIYAVETIEEGIEVLTGVPAGRRDEKGNFPAGSINYLANKKLKKFAELSK